MSRLKLVPTSKIGRRAFVAMFGLPIGLVLFFFFVSQGQRGGQTLLDSSPWLTISLFGGALVTIAAGLMAIFAVLRRRERGLASVAPIAFGALTLLILLAEAGGHE